jgi:hypothetical protein
MILVYQKVCSIDDKMTKKGVEKEKARKSPYEMIKQLETMEEFDEVELSLKHQPFKMQW